MTINEILSKFYDDEEMLEMLSTVFEAGYEHGKENERDEWKDYSNWDQSKINDPFSTRLYWKKQRSNEE